MRSNVLVIMVATLISSTVASAAQDQRSVAQASTGSIEAPVAEPSAASCQFAVEAARALVDALPTDDLSRRMAESYLVQAKVEAGNGEFDDCLEMAAHATIEVREHRHRLGPGESLEAHPLR